MCVCVCPAQGIWSGLLGVLQEEGGGGSRLAPGPARAPPPRHITVCVCPGRKSVELPMALVWEGRKPWAQA